MQHIIQEHQEQVLPSLEVLASWNTAQKKYSHWTCGEPTYMARLQAFSRLSFTGKKWLRVTSCLKRPLMTVDLEGSFFGLALEACSQSKLFVGPPTCKIIPQNVASIQQRKYLIAGELARW